MSMSDLDIMHARDDEARERWYDAHDDTWLCRECHCLVEYTPAEYAGPCDHAAYCSRCVRDEVVLEGDDEWAKEEGEWLVFWYRGQTGELDTFGGFIKGTGAQSWAAHVAAGTLR